MDLAEKDEIFLRVIRENKGIVYKIANLYCSNAEDRKDLVQEIILQLWRSFDRYDSRSKHSTWVYRIALNVAISSFRKESSRKKISSAVTATIFEFTGNDMPGDKEAELAILEQAISQLKELDKALMLLYLEEKSYKEISEIIGITETNVATKLSRIRNNLKQVITQLKRDNNGQY